MTDSDCQSLQVCLILHESQKFGTKFNAGFSSVGMVADSSAIGPRIKPGSNLSISENLFLEPAKLDSGFHPSGVGKMSSNLYAVGDYCWRLRRYRRTDDTLATCLRQSGSTPPAGSMASVGDEHRGKTLGFEYAASLPFTFIFTRACWAVITVMFRIIRLWNICALRVDKRQGMRCGVNETRSLWRE